MNGALIAMSGVVDSSVAALLSVEQGFDCVGAMMKLFSNDEIGASGDKACCSLENAQDARDVAYRLGIPFYVLNYSESFKEFVIDRFIRAYQNGETPNPCIDCNRFLKFECLSRRAKELGKDYIVTGHYARIEPTACGDRFLLKKGLDSSKDQSYVLYAMTQEKLRSTLFPLGGLTKKQVREIAIEHGFVNANKKDSQDICFVQDNDYAAFIRQRTGQECPKGRFIDVNGNDLGENRGIIHYTVGQRRGLGISYAEPLYVCSINAGSNSVIVGTQAYLYAKTLIARDINLIPVDRLDKSIRIRARVRYKQPEQAATVWQIGADALRVEFDEPQRAMTKGQAVVLYDGDTVVGGGTISEVITSPYDYN